MILPKHEGNCKLRGIAAMSELRLIPALTCCAAIEAVAQRIARLVVDETKRSYDVALH